MITVFKSSKIWTKVVRASHIQYSQRLLMTPFPGPTLFTPHPLHTTPLYHFTTSLQLTSHPSSHHSPLPLITIPPHPSSDHSNLRPLKPLPPPLPHTTQNSSLLPHTAPFSVAETRNNVAVMILFLIYSPRLFNLCSTSTRNPPPPNESLMALQLVKLAKFMKEQL